MSEPAYALWGQPPPDHNQHLLHPHLQLEYHYDDPSQQNQQQQQNPQFVQQPPIQRPSLPSFDFPPVFPATDYLFSQSDATLANATDTSFTSHQPTLLEPGIFSSVSQHDPSYIERIAPPIHNDISQHFLYSQDQTKSQPGPSEDQSYSIKPVTSGYQHHPTVRDPSLVQENEYKRQKGDSQGGIEGEQDTKAESPSDDTKLKPIGACARCKIMKIKCEFKTDPYTCKRCLNGGHDCYIPGHKKRRAPPKREHLLNQIRDQASRIQELMEQLEAANDKVQNVHGTRESMIARMSPEISSNGTLSLTSDSCMASPTQEESRADVQAWIAKARESIEAFGGLISDAVDTNVFEQENFSEDDEDLFDFAIEDDGDENHNESPEVPVSQGTGSTSPARSTHAGSNHRKSSNSKPLAPLLKEDAPLGLMAKMSISVRKNSTNSAEAEDSGYGVAAPHFFESRENHVASPDPTVLAPASHQPPQILMRNLVTPQQVEQLFKIYFDNMNVTLSLLDPHLYTAQRTYWRSPFLFTVICAIASRFDTEHPDLYEQLMNYAQLAAGTALISGPKTVEVVAACFLLSVYPVPMRRWEEDRNWLYLGMAIRVATDLNLHIPITAKPRNEHHAREILNRTRIWLNCYNRDRSTASWNGKPSTIGDNDYMALHSGTWYKSSEYNVPNFDIHLCAYNAELRVLREFCRKIYSDPLHPTGLNKNLDIKEIASETDDELFTLSEKWFEEFKNVPDPENPQNRYRTVLLRLVTGYTRLVILSFGFHHAFGKGSDVDGLYFNRCMCTAMDALQIFVDGLSSYKTYLRHGPEAHCIFVTFPSAFLIKILHPKYAAHLTIAQRVEIRNLVQNTVDVLGSPEVVNDDKHSPKLWTTFLKDLLATPAAQVEISANIKRDPATLPLPSHKQHPDASTFYQPSNLDFNQAQASNQSSFATQWSLPSEHVSDPTQVNRSSESYFINAGLDADQNMLNTGFPDNFQSELSFDDNLVQSMQSMDEPWAWQNMAPPGLNCNWMAPLEF